MTFLIKVYSKSLIFLYNLRKNATVCLKLVLFKIQLVKQLNRLELLLIGSSPRFRIYFLYRFEWLLHSLMTSERFVYSLLGQASRAFITSLRALSFFSSLSFLASSRSCCFVEGISHRGKLVKPCTTSRKFRLN